MSVKTALLVAAVLEDWPEARIIPRAEGLTIAPRFKGRAGVFYETKYGHRGFRVGLDCNDYHSNLPHRDEK